MSERPPATRGMHHLALNVRDLEATERFYVELVGMQVEWRPDPDNVYLCSGSDNLALHRVAAAPEGPQRLDHLGFILRTPEDVDAWYAFLAAHGVRFRAAPRTHRDGARSFYCEDPDGNVVQFIYHSPLSDR
jgi:catechol 2,3-dioxygenase-like lactoylglutathione lyase family enzyme